jgi:glutamate-1-semialdehyde aminotransferase
MSKGQKLYNKAKKIIPGGTMLLSKNPDLFLPEFWPAYFVKSKGCRLWTLDNQELIDMSLMGVGTNSLGYCNNEVDSAVKETINNGNMTTLNCPEEVKLAEELIEMNPWAEMVRFARTGGEANSIAVRIARAASGRDNVAICGYHGWHDWYLSVNHNSDDDELSDHLIPGLQPLGVPKKLKNSTFPFQYNNFSELEELVKNKNIGVIKMEVVRNIKPKDNFLQKVRNLATKNNIVLIFDECTSGFREAYGGIYKNYNVVPDIVIYGKTMGNGYAITSVLGKKEIMEYAQKTFISSTFWTERIGPTAALKSLEVMKKNKSWEIITNIGNKIKDGWEKISETYKVPIVSSPIPAVVSFNIDCKNKNYYKTYITQEMLKKGILASTNFYACTEHNQKHIDKYLLILEEIFKTISKCESGQIDIRNLLDGKVCNTGFGRLN